MGKMARGWQLTKMSLRILRKDKELLLFPILSGVFTILIIAGFLVGMFVSLGIEGFFDFTQSYGYIILFVGMYILGYFITIFFNAAIIGCAMMRLEGGIPRLRDGFRIAKENIRGIIAWTLFAATVGLILRSLQERAGIIGRLIIGFLGIAWSLGTFFVVPVLIYEKVGPITAMKRSGSLFRSAWGETLTGSIGLGAIFFLAGLVGIVPIVVGGILGGWTGLLAGLIIAFAYWIALAVILSAAQSVLTAALYRFATTGKVSREFGSQQLFKNPWRY